MAVATSASTLYFVAWFVCSVLRPTWCSSWVLVKWVPSWQPKTWIIVLLVIWIFAIFKGTVSTVRRIEKDAAEKMAKSEVNHESEITRRDSQIEDLKRTVESLKAQRQVSLSISLKTGEKPKAILMGSSQDASGQPIQAYVSEMTLLIYNHGERPVVLRGCKLWKLHATESIQEFTLHDVVTSSAPSCVDITEPVLRAISGSKTFNFVSLQGKYSVRIVIAYSQGLSVEDARPHDFQLSCRPWRGGTTLRIDANEITQEQS